MVDLIKKAIKYCFVGGFASVVDLGLYTLAAWLLGSEQVWHLFIATTCGFIGGLITNYLLSLRFVWKKEAGERKDKRVQDFVSFVVIGLMGLGISYGVIYIVFDLWHWNHIIAKIIAMGISLIWNFVARNFFVFGKRGKDKASKPGEDDGGQN